MSSRAEYLREWKKRNAERYQETVRKWREEHREELLAKKREWYRANAERIREDRRRERMQNREAVIARERNVKRKSGRDPKKEKARQLVADAISRGAMIRGACERCGVTELRSHDDARTLIHAHHDDYAEPLTVRWLCVHCHALLHRRVA